MENKRYRTDNGQRDKRGRFTEGNPGGPGRPKGCRNKDPLADLRKYLSQLSNPDDLNAEQRREIITMLMDILLSPKTNNDLRVRIGHALIEAQGQNIKHCQITVKNQ